MRNLTVRARSWAWLMLDRMSAALGNAWGRFISGLGGRLYQVFSPIGALSRDIPSGVLAIWTSALLAVVLIIAYFST